MIFEDDQEKFIPYKKGGVGKGKTKSGRKKSWKKNHYFELDLLTIFGTELSQVAFKKRFAGYSADELEWFFKSIEKNVLRPKETMFHARNKLLLWIDWLHNCLSGAEMKDKYKIGESTAVSHINDLCNGIIDSYKDEDVVKFPDEQQKQKMVKILKQRKAHMPYVLFSLDGSHARCTGRKYKNRLSHKYKFLPCFNVLFIIERAFMTICSFNLDESSNKHDLTVLRDTLFYNKIEEIMDGWLIIADKGYDGALKEVKNIAAAVKLNDKRRKWFSKDFWREHNAARAGVERCFAFFFWNKFTKLAQWRGKSKETFKDWAMNVICCIIMYNVLKIRTNINH